MRLPSWVGSIGKIRLGTTLLALYGFFSMFEYFLLRGLGTDCTRTLYFRFENETDISGNFKWVLSSRLDLVRGLEVGLIAGVVVAILIFIIVNITIRQQNRYMQRRLRRGRHAVIAGILVLASFFIVFVGASFFEEPIVLGGSMDFVLAFSTGVVCFFSTVFYINHHGFHIERRDFIENTSAQLKKFELEFAGAKEMFHLATWVLVTMVFGALTIVLLRYYYDIPSQVRACPEFGLAIFCLVFGIVTVAVGFFGGVIYQITRNMEDVIFAIKDRWKKK